MKYLLVLLYHMYNIFTFFSGKILLFKLEDNFLITYWEIDKLNYEIKLNFDVSNSYTVVQ